ncbi:ribosomal RNA small subunit methyltransferase B [Photobacterium damselae subsp. damselae CIP 102761]|uniref:16S rRNA (cytosine(967)-C(5))-methyltransferase n=1 Tax=Photobacterium damselae subsp. damselae CIP 102761 TaxID=675817 RepID=D0Z0Z0_PHODD|nr:ribosomal RNA small subunit methyltransferase B [Photobacterium damselae subsp. damselae CIP 102761]
MRNYQRQQQELDAQAVSHDAGKYGHPSWLLKLLKQAYPNDVDAICAANNTKAPMWLRVNRQHHNRDEYRKLLDAEGIATELHPQAGDALRLLSPCDVYKLPGFEQGWVSVQDAAAQLAIEYLQPQAGELILDCCAAPGGKTAHILEHVPSAQVVAIDCDEHRLARVHDNLQRLNLQAKVLCADARYPEKWWDGDKFDRILLDAPCSATGVIRRHPDIKWLRRGEDIAALAQLQAEIFDAMWLQLKSGGTLVYATCSITPQENRDQVSAFLTRTADATLVGSEATNPGRQILPGEENMDGFYYAVLQKA